MTKEEDLGKLTTEARLTVYKKTALPTVAYNLETWTRIEGYD